MPYYAIRVYNDDGTPLATRVEKARGPREACKLAFGVIYDSPYDTAKYVDLGGRKPAYIPQYRLKEMMADDRWEKIPKKGH